MNHRLLGANGPVVSAIGLGCMSMSQSYGPRDDAESTRAIHRAFDLGVTHFDLANNYGPVPGSAEVEMKAPPGAPRVAVWSTMRLT